MNNNNHQAGSSADQSALSLLVNAAEGSRDARSQQESMQQHHQQQQQQHLQQQQQQQQSFANQLRQQSLGRDQGGGLSLEEQLLLQQQLQGASFGGGGGGGGSMNLLNQLREQNLFSQYGQQQQHQQQQQQQLAMLLGLGGGQGLGGGHQADVHSALAAQLRQQAQQQQQQQPQFTSADLLALSRSGGLGGLSGILGNGGGLGAGGASSFATELEGLQRLEELERRQRLLAAAAAGNGGLPQGPVGIGSMARNEQIDPNGSPLLMPKMNPEDSRPPVPTRPISSVNVGSARKKLPGADLVGGVMKPSSNGGLGAIASADDNKEELEKAPGSVIVPCRARGMPMDHNFKTAYFVIPENVKHGEELICSYFACRNAGIKFRYCSHCKVPVAKRNFRKRHKHGGQDVAQLPGEDSDGEEEMAAVKKGIPSQIMAGHKGEEVEADGISSQSTDSNQGKAVGLAHSAVRNFGNSKKQAAAAMAMPVPLVKDMGSRKATSEREMRWLTLLTRRPATKDGDAMSGWLMEVLAVSDLDTPLQQPGQVGDAVLVSEEPNKMPAVPAKEDVDTASSEEYNSSSDESSNKLQEKPTSFEEVARKRPTEMIDDAVGAPPPSGEGSNFASGSFAAWKERKKQKKQDKSGSDEA